MSAAGAPTPSRTLMTLRTLVVLVVALIFGAVAAALTFATGKGIAPAVLAGLGAFGASVKILHDLVE